MKRSNSKYNILQLLGIVLTCLFFYVYTVGSVFGRESAYEFLFLPVIVIAIIRLVFNPLLIRQYRRYYLWQAAFITLMGVSVLYTINQREPAAQWLVMMKILLKVSSVAFICGDFSGVKKLLWGLSICGFSVFATLLLTGHLYEGFRLGTDLMGNANSFGLLITVFLTGALYCSVYAKTRFWSILSIAIIVVDVYMIFLSGGRKFLLYGIVLMYGLLIMSNKKRPISIIGPSIIVAVVVYLGYLAVMKIPILYDSIGIRLVGLGTDEGALGTDSQIELMKTGLYMFIERPLLGWGIAGFQEYYFQSTGIYFYAHSNYIELMADYGIAGLFIFYSQYLYCIRIMWRNRKRDSEELHFYLPLLFAILVIEVFSITFNQTAFIPLFVMFISGFCYRLEKGRIIN